MNRHLLAAIALGLIACSDAGQQPGTGTAPCDGPTDQSPVGEPNAKALPAASLTGNWRLCAARRIGENNIMGDGGRLVTFRVEGSELRGYVKPKSDPEVLYLSGPYDPTTRRWNITLHDNDQFNPTFTVIFAANGKHLVGEIHLDINKRDTITGAPEDGDFTCPVPK